MKLFTSLGLFILLFAANGLFAQENHEVTVDNFSFSPENITITAGDTVTWINVNGFHNVNGSLDEYPDNPEGFTNGEASNDPWEYSFVFTQTGTYDYHCDPHLSIGMVGTVTVQEAGGQETSLLLSGVFDGPLSGGTPKGVELYVLEDIPDLSIYGIGSANNGDGTDGIEYTFPAMAVSAGTFLYLANDGAQFNAFFGFDADFVDDGSNASVNINGDDAIELFLNGEVVDVFGDINTDGSGEPWEYLDGWAYRLSGTGPDGSTFVLTNWEYSGVDALDGESSNASAANPFPLGTYEPPSGGEIIANNDIVVTGFNEAVTIDILLNDIIPNVETISVDEGPANGSTEVNVDMTITYTPNTDFCGEDQFTYTICDIGGCASATVAITVECPVPVYTIGAVTTVDGEGVADSLGVVCQLQGIVYGVNLNPNGLQFTIIDGNNDGIGVFSGGEDFGYSVQEGDEVAIRGEISQFRGLTQISPDTVWMVSSGNILEEPAVVTALGEDTESQLVKINNVSLVDPAAWDPGGSGFNVEVTDGTNTYDVRIDNDVGLFNMEAPTGTFNITGIGGQFDTSTPLLEGYQLLPRYMEDIEPASTVISPELGRRIRFFPNPAGGQLNIQSEIPLDLIRVSNLLGQGLLEWQRPGLQQQLDISSLQAGTYLLTFISGNKAWTQELVRR